MIKNKIKNLDLSTTLKINEISKKLEQEGKEIIKFGFGQSPFPVPVKVVDELKKNAHQKSYLPIQGLDDLRVAISKYESKKKKKWWIYYIWKIGCYFKSRRSETWNSRNLFSCRKI